MNYLFFFFLILVLIPLTYWLLLAAASICPAEVFDTSTHNPRNLFMIVIPAHNEEIVIQASINQIQRSNYPKDLYEVHVIADYCEDNTAAFARDAGAIVHERNVGPKTGKGAALSWLFEGTLIEERCDAIVIFDADTIVDQNFLRFMDIRLEKGEQVIQGQHVISNPNKGWFASLTWAMFLVDNRFQNLGRSNLNLSAKNMGDSICFQKEVLRKMGWGEGLTEDYQLRQRLILENIQIAYEPAAIGFGEAPRTWSQARTQRTRWLRGTSDANKRLSKQLLFNGINNRNWAMLDGAAQAFFPSYSTLTLISIFILLLQILFLVTENIFINSNISIFTILPWVLIIFILFLYPLVGLALEGAPIKAFLVMLSGPFYIIWRTILAIKSRIGAKKVVWIRTAHGE